jgi:hypothetical protein
MVSHFQLLCVFTYGYVDWDYVCAGPRGSGDAKSGSICSGDYGSGMVSQRYGIYEIDGVNSITHSCSLSKSTAYARIHYYRNWLRFVMGG